MITTLLPLCTVLLLLLSHSPSPASAGGPFDEVSCVEFCTLVLIEMPSKVACHSACNDLAGRCVWFRNEEGWELSPVVPSPDGGEGWTAGAFFFSASFGIEGARGARNATRIHNAELEVQRNPQPSTSRSSPTASHLCVHVPDQ